MGKFDMFTLGQVAALVTIGGAGIYLLGLIALVWPIYHRVTRSPSVTLFAVSRIPRLMVAGYGVRIFRTYPLIFGGVFALAGLGYVQIIQLLSWLVDYLLGGIPPLPARVIFILIFILLFGVTLVILIRFGAYLWQKTINESRRAYSAGPSIGEGSKVLLEATLILVGLAAFALFALALSKFGAHEYFGGSLWLLISLLLTGVPPALLAYPPLPKVEITRIPITIAGQALSRTVKGRLLDHSSGSWYFFDERGMLIAISDSQVDEARIYEDEEERAPLSNSRTSGQ